MRIQLIQTRELENKHNDQIQCNCDIGSYESNEWTTFDNFKAVCAIELMCLRSG